MNNEDDNNHHREDDVEGPLRPPNGAAPPKVVDHKPFIVRIDFTTTSKEGQVTNHAVEV